jgi:hypothetical protein
VLHQIPEINKDDIQDIYNIDNNDVLYKTNILLIDKINKYYLKIVENFKDKLKQENNELLQNIKAKIKKEPVYLKKIKIISKFYSTVYSIVDYIDESIDLIKLME